MSPEYHYISYPLFLGWFPKLWKRFMCRRGWHLWDEVVSSACADGDDFECKNWGHCLYCDACGMVVHIGRVENGNERA